MRNRDWDRDEARGGRDRADDRGFFERAAEEVRSWVGLDERSRRRTAEARGGYDPPRRGQFVGRGPRGYERSDERILEDVSDRLSDDGLVDASDIEVTVNHGEVTLAGTVPDRDQKRRAEAVTEEVPGVRQVYNLLRTTSRALGPGGDVLGLGATLRSADIHRPLGRRRD
ncbi:MAG TPA: BON domain-containing protein [Candidatus Thermoplasmatota archaeon]|nr:BON domain-containing protein [Candidatus Thermoplasmatota archaeon]